jgi:predicted transcriptional regulator
MLGKLLAEGLIKKMDNGRYSVTKKGIDMLTDIESARNILQKTNRYFISNKQCDKIRY